MGLSGLTACSDDQVSGSSSVATTSATAVAVSQPVVGAGTLPNVTEPRGGIEPEPTGVPGIDDLNPFCASWAVYSSTLQAIGVANAFGELPSVEAVHLELIASASINAAVGGIGSRWPAVLVGERSVVLTDLVGPYGRRAEKALAALRDAGVTDAEIDELQMIWGQALRDRDPAAPVIRMAPLRADLDARVSAAAVAFDAAVTPFADDPSLIVDTVVSPDTDAYLAVTCPELASSGVGDAV